MRRQSLLILIILVLCSTLQLSIAEDVGQDAVEAENVDDGEGEGEVAANEEEDQVQEADQVEENNGGDAGDAGDDGVEVEDEDNEELDENVEEEDVAEAEAEAGANGDDNVQANQNNNGNSNNSNQNGNSYSSNADTNYKGQVSVCSDSVIQVQDIVLYCDSPGTYYYGSGKYRNSQTCMPGDKARVQVNFYIANHDMIQQAGNYALVDVYVEGSDDVSTVTIYDNADLCSLSTLSKKSGNTCPYNGYYQIKTSFYWGKGSSSEAFEPKVVVGFKSNVKKEVYDFGGANTNLCRGSTFFSWSDGVKISYANAIGNFMKSFGLLLVTIMMMGGLVWFLSKRPRSYKRSKTPSKSTLSQAKEGILAKLSRTNLFARPNQAHRDLSIHVDEEFDFRKIQTAGNRDLVDF